MLLTGYRLEIFKSKCDTEATGVHCFAHLSDDISAVLPFLNSVLGAFVYISNPPSLMLKNYGKLITLEARKIAVNALKDEEEAEKIIAWLQREINETWEKREAIDPSTESERRPVLLDVLKLLPRTNCQECGEKTCMVFATRVIEGSFDQEDCPSINPEKREILKTYLSQFRFE
jgi:ArsR family metal-binding transcriptional regulator